MKNMGKLALVASMLCISSMTYAAADDIIGVWQTFDDKTGAKKALVKFYFNKKRKTYYARITKVTPIQGYKPKVTCHKCPGTFKDKKIQGMVVVWNLKPTVKDGKVVSYDGGKIIDPNTGKIYDYSGKLNTSKSILTSRAFLGSAMLGRTQQWIRRK